MNKEVQNILKQYKDPIHPELPMTLVEATSAIQALLVKERIDELERMATYRHYGKDYQDSMDELAEYKEARIATLNQYLKEKK